MTDTKSGEMPDFLNMTDTTNTDAADIFSATPDEAVASSTAKNEAPVAPPKPTFKATPGTLDTGSLKDLIKRVQSGTPPPPKTG